MGGAHSRNKGLNFERWVCNKLKHIFPNAQRLFECREGFGFDIENVGQLRIQCKAYKQYAPLSKIKEAGVKGIPMLITKGDREEVLVALSLDNFLKILDNPEIIKEDIE